MDAGPVYVAQITDCHVLEPGELLAGRVDTAAALHAAIDHLSTLTPAPDIVVATGDLVNDGRPAQYDHLTEILARLRLPLMLVPGNHDDRTELRRIQQELPTCAPLPGGGPADRLDQVVDDLPVRLVGLDTTVPGEPGGRISTDQAIWLDGVLDDEPGRPALVLQHHPPFVTGIDWMDEAEFDGGELERAALERHPQVVGVVCGHLHRPITTAFAGTMASCCPSTAFQLALALDGSRYVCADEPPAVAVHRWTHTGGMVSHLSQIGPAVTWLPDWAEQVLAAEASGPADQPAGQPAGHDVM